MKPDLEERALRSLFLNALTIAVLLVSAPASAQELVVTARRDNAEQVRAQASEFVRKVSVTAGQDQMSRMSGSYCPAIAGLDDRYVALILGRIAAAADAAGVARDRRQDCLANIAVIFTDNGDGLVKALETRAPALFANMDRVKKREVFGSGRAVRWWYGHQERDKDGMPISEGQRQSFDASLISTGVRISLSGTMIVVDVNRAAGYDLAAIASYVAMVAFAPVKEPERGPSGPPSILNLFDGGGPGLQAPKALTDWDRAYLRALYTMPMDRPAWQQRAALAAGMIRNLQDSEDAAPLP
jgi:hypothetical protein